jgi:hypothetical protein
MLVGIASASRLSTSSQTFRATFTSVEIEAGLGVARCVLTLEGSFHARTIAKATESLIGYVTRAAIQRPCSGAIEEVAVLTESMPWHIRYARFTGSLPAIATVQVNIFGGMFRVDSLGFRCLVGGTAERPAILTFNRETRGVLTSAAFGGVTGASCGVNGQLRGTSTALTALNSTARITVTLI